MKRIRGVLAVLAVAILFVGCSRKEQSVTLVTEQSGIRVEMTMDAKGDKVTRLLQVTEVPVEGLTEEQIIGAGVIIDEVANGSGGTEYTQEVINGVMKEVLIIDVTDKDMLQEVRTRKILPVEGGAVWLSLKDSVEVLEVQGWTKVK